jgi:SAM-dependent methyltransferase
MQEWIAFWNAPNSIYVNAHHRDVHYRIIAEDIRSHVPGSASRVLDYGCGEALHADLIARASATLTLSDAAPAVRQSLAQRFAQNPAISTVSPEEIEKLPDGSFDFIVMNSVAQYLSREELEKLLMTFRRLLSPNGTFVLGDVIPTGVSPVTDAMAVLRFAAQNGFLIAAFLGLVRTVFSDYSKLRTRLGLSLYAEAEILSLLRGAGFVAQRAVKNIGHNPARMTFTARPVDLGTAG